MFRKAKVLFALLLWANQAAAQTVALHGLPPAEIATLLLRDVLRVQFVLAQDVIADRGLASVRLNAGGTDAPLKVEQTLRALGLDVDRSAGVWRISKKRPQDLSALSASNLSQSDLPPKKVSEDVIVYHPQHREVGYLGGIVAAMFPDARVAKAGMSEIGPAVSSSPAPGELVVAMAAADKRKVEQLLAQIDLPVAQVALRATVFEVSGAHESESSFDVAFNLLSGRLSGGVGVPAAPSGGEMVARLSTGGFSAAVRVLSSDSRFKAVSSPRVLTRSGAEVVLVSGSQVPVLGALQFQQDGQPVQSIEYRDSGVTLRVRPTVMAGAIDLDVVQELSGFVATRTSGIDSPTLNRRSLTNKLVAQPGDVFLLGGLTETTDSSGERRGIFGLKFGKERVSRKSEVLMLIEVDAPTMPGRSRPQRSEDVSGPHVEGLKL